MAARIRHWPAEVFPRRFIFPAETFKTALRDSLFVAEEEAGSSGPKAPRLTPKEWNQLTASLVDLSKKLETKIALAASDEKK